MKYVAWIFIFFSISDFDSLNEEDHAANLQLAFDISEREFGIRSFASVKELSDDQELDKTRMTIYLSKFYELFRGTPLPASGSWHYFILMYSAVFYYIHFYSSLLLCPSPFTCMRLFSTCLNSIWPDSAVPGSSLLFYTVHLCHPGFYLTWPNLCLFISNRHRSLLLKYCFNLHCFWSSSSLF